MIKLAIAISILARIFNLKGNAFPNTKVNKIRAKPPKRFEKCSKITNSPSLNRSGPKYIGTIKIVHKIKKSDVKINSIM